MSSNKYTYDISDKFSSQLSRGLILVAIVLIVLATFSIVQSKEGKAVDPYIVSAPEEGNFSADYNSSTRKLKIKLEKGNFTRKSGKILVKQLRDKSRPLKISGYGKTKHTQYWASKSFLGTGFLNKGLTNFPVKNGESITIHNVTSNESFIIYSDDNGSNARLTRIVIWKDDAGASKNWGPSQYREKWGNESIPESLEESLNK